MSTANLRLPKGGEDGLERVVGVNDIFFSTTDAKGVITGANRTFSRLARYSFDELLRSPHSIIRHDDMPGGVFRIMWQRLAEGLPVAAYVKNQAADGQFYWVFATVTPVRGGYLSVRTRPLFEPLWEAAAGLYDHVRPLELAASAQGQSRIKVAEIGEEHLGAGLAEAGFADYQEFMVAALPEEVAARQGLVDRHRSEVVGEGSLGQVTAGSLDLDQRIDALLGQLGTLGDLSQQMQTAVTRNGHTRDLLWLTAKSAGTAVAERPELPPQVVASVQAIHEWVTRACDALGGLAEILAPQRQLIAQSRFSIALARLHNEMVLSFVDEVREEGSVGGSSVAYVPLLCETIIDDVERMSQSLDELKVALEEASARINEALDAVQRTQQFLAGWQLLVGRYGVEELDGVVTAIDDCQEGVLFHAYELSQLATSCLELFSTIDPGAALAPLPQIQNGIESLLAQGSPE